MSDVNRDTEERLAEVEERQEEQASRLDGLVGRLKKALNGEANVALDEIDTKDDSRAPGGRGEEAGQAAGAAADAGGRGGDDPKG